MKAILKRNELSLRSDSEEGLSAEMLKYCKLGWDISKAPELYYSIDEKLYYWKSELKKAI